MLDILDMLEETSGFVRLFLKTGETIIGKPDCIIFDETEDETDIIKQIRFEPLKGGQAMYFGIDEIEKFDKQE